MFKLVVLCTFLAAAAAEPSALGVLAPLSYSATVVAPATTTITKQASSVVHPSPLLYPAAVAATYSAPIVRTAAYVPAAPLATPFAYTAAHLIKKRSAPLAYQTYIAPTTYAAATPIVASTYAAATPYYSTRLISAPVLSTYTHFIKKRSAPIAYVAPTSYSTQSRFDIHGAPLVTSYASYSAPIAYSTPIAYSRLF